MKHLRILAIAALLSFTANAADKATKPADAKPGKAASVDAKVPEWFLLW